ATLASTIDINCYGEATGAIQVNVTGGPIDPNTGTYYPYTYRWSRQDDPSFVADTEDLENLPAGTYELVVIDENLCTTPLSEPVVLTQPEAPLSITNVVATNLTGYQTANGSITLDVEGGTPPYSYQWRNTEDASFSATTQDIENLSIGAYELVVTDAAGCTTNISRQLTQPEELIASIIPLTEAQQIQCYGEQTLVPLQVTVSGGVRGYSYQWYEQNDPESILYTSYITETLMVGTYVVIVTDANGNQAQSSYVVEEPAALEMTESVTDILCYNEPEGAIDITVSGGVPPYQYYWSNGENTEDLDQLRAGDYSITVVDANLCSLTRTITITQQPALFVSIDRQYPSSSSVRDGVIEATVTGGVPPYQYQWFDTQGEPLATTTSILYNVGSEQYGLVVTDTNGCELVIADIDLYEPPALEVSIEAQSVIACNGNTNTGSLRAIVSGGVPFNSSIGYEYQWYDAQTNTPLASQSAQLSGIGVGLYVVAVTDAVGTTVRSAIFSFQEPEALSIAFTTDYINCGDGADWTIEALVTGGTAPYQYRWSTGEITHSLAEVVAGSYQVIVTDARGCSTEGEVAITVPEPLGLSYRTTIPTCYEGCDGQIDIEIQGGAPPYSYQWSTGDTSQDLTNSCAGEYTVVVTDAKGCQLTDTITLANPAPIALELGEDITLCAAQSVTLDATVADGVSYSWTSTNGFTSTNAVIEVATAGIYEVTVVASNGCSASDTIFIDTTTDAIQADFIASTQVFAGEQFVVVNISEPQPDWVVWELPEAATQVYQDDNYAEMVIHEPGEYEVSLYIESGLCTDIQTKRIVVVEREFDPDDNNSNPDTTPDIKVDYSIYPNPTSDGRFSIDVTLPLVLPVSVKIFTMINNRQVASSREQGRDQYVMDYDLSGLPSGIYFILLETQGHSQVRKLMIE
ncbi:T9SS type A sorting domain-containing protein, partial [Aquimarina brevivitae]